jgi:Zn-dependent protease with chaperone function
VEINVESLEMMLMEHLYPQGPATVPHDLTKPTQTYRNHAWLAMGGLILFVVLYFALSGWFTWTAYRLLAAGLDGGLWSFVIGLGAAFLAVFMWKALFFVQHRYQIEDIEVTAEQQPKLFAFLHRLADEAGAPRAHRVYLSPRVNAAVSYDLSILNLIIPSRKNLEIGLGLVNVLTLGELKAVLAHEFGHFAQRSMAVGRWVYIAQQIAAHIISRRDALDAFLRGLSRFDLRIAWVGWLLSVIIWSIRSLMETAFRVVILAQRALSREMELQADLVSVSLTGSDALVHALHRLHVADEAWERTLNFASGETQAGRAVRNLFDIQHQVTAKLRAVLDDPQYGSVPPVPEQQPQQHRVFKMQLAQAPRMWATHPANTEREQNAKRVYIPAQIDARSAWELFEDVPALQEQMSAHVFRSAKTQPVPIEESLKRLDEQYARAYLDRKYRGSYLGRALVRHASSAKELYNPPLKPEFIVAELAALYPESLAEDLARLRELEEEMGALKALQEGYLTAPGGIIRHRGKELKRKDLVEAVEELNDELAAARERVHSHDKRCRTAHFSAAAGLGGSWDTYLLGLSKAIHYAEHAEANVRDAHGAFINVFSIVTADRRVSGKELKRLVMAGIELHNALRHVYDDEGQQIVLDRTLARRLELESWQKALGDFTLPLPDESNINEWLKVIDGWTHAATGALSALRLAALEQLLLAEAQVARFARDKMTPGAAPEATKIPDGYPLLPPGAERKRQKKLDWWDKFHVADGVAATVARLAVACGIVVGVMTVGGSAGLATVNIHNGLARPVSVTIGEASAQVGPFSTAKLDLERDAHYTVRTATLDDRLIETFDVDTERSGPHYVYNIASAAPLVEWTAVYGDVAGSEPRRLGAERWLKSDADYIFEEPPESISGSKYDDGGSRTVLTGFSDRHPQGALTLLDDAGQQTRLVAAHARWDASDSRYAMHWLLLAQRDAEFKEILADRLARNPSDVLALRLELDTAADGEHEGICKRHVSLAAGTPANADLQYVATRCLSGPQRDQAFLDLHKRFPDNGWIAMAAGLTYAEQANWNDARWPLQLAVRNNPAFAGEAAVDLARIRRVIAFGDNEVDLKDLLDKSDSLSFLAGLESGADAQPGEQKGYYHLTRGALAPALTETEKLPDVHARMLRLAAASDGATESMIAQALALAPAAGVDSDTAWAAFALALREGRNPDAYIAPLRDAWSGEADRILDLLRNLAADPRQRMELGAMHPQLRGHAYSAACVLLDKQAPTAWCRTARQLLFSYERPYFNVSSEAPLQDSNPPAADGVVRTPPRLF